MMPIASIPQIIEDIRSGKLIIVVDDEERENEGDLICAASFTSPEHINFMATYGKGLICVSLTAETCARLDLTLMVENGNALHETRFTVSVDAASGVTTGISASDRAHTTQLLADPQTQPDQLLRPGHIFPLMAAKGGVLERAGHTEAGYDLTRLAGLEPAATMVEILNPDGTMARLPDLEKFATQHHINICTIKDLIAHISGL